MHLYIGMGPPYFVAAVIRATAEFLPNDVQSTSLMITKPSGEEVEWSTAVVTQNAQKLHVKHDLAVDDLDERGPWRVWAKHALTAGGQRQSEVGSFWVYAPGERPRQ